MTRFGSSVSPALLTRTWTTQADWRSYTSRSSHPMVDMINTADSLTLTKDLFIADFEDETVGTFPSKNFTQEQGTNNATVDNTQYNSPTQSFKQVQPDGTVRTTTIPVFDGYPSMTYQYYIRFAQTDKQYNNAYYGHAGGGATILYFYSTGHLRYWNGSSAVNLPVDTIYSINTWYKIKVTINMATRKVRVYVDDGYKGEFTAYGTVADPGWPYWYWNNAATATSWLDDFRIWDTYDSDPTTYKTPATVDYQIDGGVYSHWASFSFNGTKPANTDIRFRFKSATSQSALSTANWSGYYSANATFTDVPDNRWFEAQIELSTSDTSVTPQLDDLSVNYYNAPIIRMI